MRHSVVVLSALALGGCWGSVETVFPDGLQPLEDNTAPVPDEDIEGVELVSGETDDYFWVHGRGVVHAPLVDVVQALSVPDVVQDRRGVDEYMAQLNVEPEYTHSFAITNITREIIVVEWVVTWRGLVIEGDEEDPDVFAMRYQKTDGSTLIDVMEGSIVARRLSDDWTEIELIEHLAAPRISEQDLLCYQQDLFDEVVLMTDGDVLPEYTESCR